jgi:hypothetical protein
MAYLIKALPLFIKTNEHYHKYAAWIPAYPPKAGKARE